MLEMNGIRMIQHINHSGMVIIAMTAHDLSIKPQLLQAGFDDCLFKPFHLEDLSQLLGIEKHPDTSISSKQAIASDKPTAHSRFQPLLTFAEGDTEVENEILQTVKAEMEGYHERLEKELEGTLNLENIGKVAHKLLPLASMLQMQCIEPLKALAPEHITEQNSATTRKNILNILKELSKVLEEIYVRSHRT